MKNYNDNEFFSGCGGNDPWGDAHSSWRSAEERSRHTEHQSSPFDGRAHAKPPKSGPATGKKNFNRAGGQEPHRKGSYQSKQSGASRGTRTTLRRSKGRRASPKLTIFLVLVIALMSVLAGFTSAVLDGDISLDFFGLHPEYSFRDDWAENDEDEGFNWDVETVDEADEKYTVAPYEGDSSGLSIHLNNHKGRKAMELPDLYEHCLPSTVSITVYAGSSAGYGSGVIMTEDGFIVTCAHLLENMQSAVVTTSDGQTYDGYLVGLDSQTDLAVLKIDAEGLTAAEFGDSSRLRIGEDVCALGDSLGVQFRSTLSNGIVSGLNREVSSNSYSMVLIQTTAAVNSGNSGGALFNSYGQVVGIVNMKMSSRVGSTSIDNMGLSIPSVTVKDVVESLADNGSISRPVLGISCYGIDTTAARVNGIPEGLWVTEIQDASACDDAGLCKGDLITAVNGVEVNSVAQFKEATANCAIGDDVTLTVWRDEELRERLEQEDEKLDAADAADSSAEGEKERVEYHFEYYGDIDVMLISSDDIK